MDVNSEEAPGDREARGRATRAMLLDVARDRFGTEGYRATSIDEIVERAGVTKGAFYHHFESKKELFRQVFEAVEREISRAAFVVHFEHEPFEPRRERTPEERNAALDRFLAQSDEEVWAVLEERCRRYIELHLDPRVRQVVLVDARWVLSWDERRTVEEDQGVVLLRADLRRARQRGLLRPLSLRALSLLLKGALSEACMLVAAADDPDSELERAMAVLRALLAGLRAEPPPAHLPDWLP